VRNPETASIIERLIACRDTLKVVEGQFAVNLQPERAVMADAANALDAYDKTMQRIAEAPSPTPPAGDGWRMVPVEPTEAMLGALGDAFEEGVAEQKWEPANEIDPALCAYRAVLAARPGVPGEAPPSDQKEAG